MQAQKYNDTLGAAFSAAGGTSSLTRVVWLRQVQIVTNLDGISTVAGTEVSFDMQAVPCCESQSQRLLFLNLLQLRF